MASPTNHEPPAKSVGPTYRPDAEKPTATVSEQVSHDNVMVLPQTPQLIALLTWVSAQHQHRLTGPG
jgi:uracil phosphoribosyltransferase